MSQECGWSWQAGCTCLGEHSVSSWPVGIGRSLWAPKWGNCVEGQIHAWLVSPPGLMAPLGFSLFQGLLWKVLETYPRLHKSMRITKVLAVLQGPQQSPCQDASGAVFYQLNVSQQCDAAAKQADARRGALLVLFLQGFCLSTHVRAHVYKL